MIAEEERYVCSGRESPNEAVYVCTDLRCGESAFICRKRACSCNRIHRNHRIVALESVLSEIARPSPLELQLHQLEHTADEFFDRLVRNAESMRTSHHQHLRTHATKLVGSDTLRQKLLNHHSLDGVQATGECFGRLLQQHNSNTLMQDPYKNSLEEFNKEMVAAHRQITQALMAVKKLWESESVHGHFAFGMLKHASIKINKKRTNAFTSQKRIALAVVEPRLSMEAPSKISFRMTKFGYFVGVGICYRDIVRANNFEFNGNPKGYVGDWFGQGAYLNLQHGFIVSHSVKEDNDVQKSKLEFGQDDTVTVEFDPATGLLRYEKEGSLEVFVQTTSIRSTQKEPIHFCVLLHSDEVSIS